jgi:hypothetical protein
MNAFVPLINRGFKPKRFGEKINWLLSCLSADKFIDY